MKNLLGAALLTGAVLLTASAAHAQTTETQAPAAAVSPAPPATTQPAKPTRKGKNTPPPQQLTPEEEAHEQQMRLLEARTGNTSFSAGNNSGFKQTDKSTGGFTLRKFKAMPGQEDKRGVSKRVQVGATTNGEPINRHKKTFFSF
ncbi:MAG: hypothetical protein ACRYFX_20950 [Janthinobacterium lividum]